MRPVLGIVPVIGAVQVRRLTPRRHFAGLSSPVDWTVIFACVTMHRIQHIERVQWRPPKWLVGGVFPSKLSSYACDKRTKAWDLQPGVSHIVSGCLQTLASATHSLPMLLALLLDLCVQVSFIETPDFDFKITWGSGHDHENNVPMKLCMAIPIESMEQLE